MVGFLKSLFRVGSVRDDQPALPAVGKMSFEQICSQLSTWKGAMPANLMTGLVKRLYEIAFYDHHVPIENRERACVL